MKINKNILLIVLITFIFLNKKVQAQLYSFKGNVSFNSKPIYKAKISIQPSGKVTFTDLGGNFRFDSLQIGKYFLEIDAEGFNIYEQTINIKSNNEQIFEIKLKEYKEIEEITIVAVAKSKTQLIKEQSFAVDAIDLKPLQNLDLNINSILNQSTGIRIRESGGLGSDFQFSLNGFTGNQVRFFVDGLPTSALGSAYSINAIPVNNIDRIDIYKGVVPVNLGADALGGAINFVTNNSVKNYLDASYSYGSFNTHRASLVGKYTTAKNFVLNTSCFYNYSENNYKIKVNLIDKNTGKIDENPTEVRRFNDAFKSATGMIEFGFVNKKFADKLLFGVIGSITYKEFQNALEVARPAGQVYRDEQGIVSTFKFEKQNLFTKGLTFKLSSIYGHNQSRNVDTSARTYDWFGNWTIQPLSATSGELAWYATLFTFKDKTFLKTATLEYEFNSKHGISLNNTYSRISRIGFDPIAVSAIPFSEPNVLAKNFTGFSYQLKLLDNKWRSNVFGKAFYMNSHQFTDQISDSLDLISQKYLLPAYGIATSYFIFKSLQIKASFEDTYRLPEAEEMFGNGLLLLANPSLEPEKSKNFNFGALFGKKFGKHLVNVEANYLLRLPENLIRTVASGVLSQNENLANSEIRCYEVALSYGFKDFFKLEVNGAYQDMINTVFNTNGEPDYLYGDRLPNIPYLFGNVALTLNSKELGKNKSRMSLYYSLNYVEEFFLRWPSQGAAESKNVIPTQITQNISLSYTAFDGKYNATFSCTNLMNSELYDNFRVQKPGRMFSVKLRYYFKQKSNK